jgi:hypothetical protein
MERDLTLLVCPALRRETEAAVGTPGLEGVRVEIVPVACDPTAAQRAELARVVVARVEEHGACCLLGGGCLARFEPPPALGASLVVFREETCFQLLTSSSLVDHWIRDGAYLLTPGWLASWRERLEGWGLHGELAGAFFGESARRLLLLDTGVHPDAPAHLQELAGHLGLPGDVAPVGLDHYRLVLLEALRRARALMPRFGDVDALRRRAADGAAVFDFVVRLSGARGESEVVDRLLDLACALLAPERLAYWAVEGERFGEVRLHPPAAGPAPDLEEELRALASDVAFSASGRGILFRVANEEETFGLCAVDGLAFPRHRDRYARLARSLARAGAVAIGSARALARAARAEAERERVEKGLDEALQDVRTLRGLLPICASCKRIRDGDGRWTRLEEYITARSEAVFSHGVCPECFERLYPGLDDDAP